MAPCSLATCATAPSVDPSSTTTTAWTSPIVASVAARSCGRSRTGMTTVTSARLSVERPGPRVRDAGVEQPAHETLRASGLRHRLARDEPVDEACAGGGQPEQPQR